MVWDAYQSFLTTRRAFYLFLTGTACGLLARQSRQMSMKIIININIYV